MRPPRARTPPWGRPWRAPSSRSIRAAAEAAEARAEQPGARARDVFTDAAAAAREALARTPDQLAVLRDAGVVDAGGRGLSVILDAAETVLTGRRPTPVTAPIGAHRIPIPTSGVEHPDLTPEGPAYEVMYLLDADDDARTRPQAGPRRPRRLAGRGRRRRALERPRPHRRGRRRGRGRDRRRAPAPDPGHALRRAGRGGTRATYADQEGPPGRRRRGGSRPGEAVRGGGRHGRGRGTRQPAVDRDDPRGHPRVLRPGGDRAAQRRRLGAGGPGRGADGRGRPTASGSR